MTVERVLVPAISWAGGLLIPLSDGQGGWWTTDSSGTTFWRSASDVRAFVEDQAPGDLADLLEVEPEWADAHRALADLIEELGPS